jgi:hypothetical protein
VLVNDYTSAVARQAEQRLFIWGVDNKKARWIRVPEGL